MSEPVFGNLDFDQLGKFSFSIKDKSEFTYIEESADMKNCSHDWYDFNHGFGTIESFIDESTKYHTTYNQRFRICKLCYRIEKLYVYMDSFKQQGSYWEQFNYTDIELENRIKKIKRELKIDSINDVT